MDFLTAVLPRASADNPREVARVFSSVAKHDRPLLTNAQTLLERARCDDGPGALARLGAVRVRLHVHVEKPPCRELDAWVALKRRVSEAIELSTDDFRIVAYVPEENVVIFEAPLAVAGRLLDAPDVVKMGDLSRSRFEVPFDAVYAALVPNSTVPESLKRAKWCEKEITEQMAATQRTALEEFDRELAIALATIPKETFAAFTAAAKRKNVNVAKTVSPALAPTGDVKTAAVGKPIPKKSDTQREELLKKHGKKRKPTLGMHRVISVLGFREQVMGAQGVRVVAASVRPREITSMKRARSVEGVSETSSTEAFSTKVARTRMNKTVKISKMA